jgi:capsid portal protein
MKEDQIVEIWTLFKEYVDKKTLDIVAEKYVDMLADYGVSDETLKESLGSDAYLDDAISYYLDIGDDDDGEWDE